MKKVICLLVCFMLLFCTGCDDITPEPSGIGIDTEQTEQAPTTLETITLAYHTGQTQNPLVVSDPLNEKLDPAIYLPVITFDESLDIIYGAAKECKQTGNTVTLTADTARKFSDGTPLSAKHIADSLRLVKNTPTSPYYRKLQNVTDIDVSGDTVTVTFAAAQIGAVYCLDIPVVLEKGGKFYGCGSYAVGRKNGMDALVASRYAKTKPSMDFLYLCNPEKTENLADMFNSGVIDVLPTELLDEFSAGRDYKSVSYLTREMLFLGCNTEYGDMKEAANRFAVGTLLPREDIVKTVLMENGTATALPFYPAWSKAPTDKGSEDVVKAFTDAGFLSKNGEILRKNGEPLTFDLLVDESDKVMTAIAEKIKSRADSFGITVTVIPLAKNELSYRLGRGDFEMYLDSCTLPDDMDISFLFQKDGARNYGKADVPELEKAYEDFVSGKTDAAAFCGLFRKLSPFVPIAFTKNIIYYTDGIGVDGTVSISRPYGNLSSWSAK